MIWIPTFGLPLLISSAIAVLSVVGADRPTRLRDILTRFSWVAVVPAAVAALVDDGEKIVVEQLVLGTSVQVDDVGRPMVIMASLVYGMALAFVPRSASERPYTLTAFLLLCCVGNVGVFIAADLVTFYLAFAAMSFLGYAIVVHERTDKARRAGVVYLVLTVIGETAVLSGFLLIAAQGAWAVTDVPAAVASSPAKNTIILLVLVGFGVKAGIVPLHTWLPLAHPAAPTPASAVLSGVMLKAGIVGWLRMLPLGLPGAESGWGSVFLVLALAGGLLAIPVGLLQDDPKVILAYSSISQLGFIAAMVGAALTQPSLAEACIAASVLYSVHHGMTKSMLFLGVQMWDRERMRRRALAAVFAVAGLSLAGAPLTSGYVAKYAAKHAVDGVQVPGISGLDVADVLVWFGVGSTLLIARFVAVMRSRERSVHPTSRTRGALWALVCVAAVVPVAVLAKHGSSPLVTPGWFDPATWWTQSWPILLAMGVAALAGAVTRLPRFDSSRVAHPRGDLVPPGDLVVVEEKAAKGLTRLVEQVFRSLGDLVRKASSTISRRAPTGERLDRVQQSLGLWQMSGMVWVALLAVALMVTFVYVPEVGR